MQDGLKKAFMRGVCALNFEAMNVLGGQDQNLEREMLKNFHLQSQIQDDQLSQLSYNISETTEPTKVIQMESRGEQKVESKDHLWKPAPLVGREFVQKEVEHVPFSQQIKEMKPYVLPSQFQNNVGKAVYAKK